MTVQIISRGKLPDKDPLFTTGCQKCGTVFSFNKSDTKVFHDWRDGDYMQLDCPVCGAFVTKNL